MSERPEFKNEQLRRISDAHLIEEGGHSELVRKSVIFIVIMLLFFIFWSTFTKVDEVAVSFGDIQPIENVQTLQHLEGGIVAKVFVKNSQEVQAGEVLMELNPEQVRSELQRAQSREVSLMLNAERLRAFINNTPNHQIDWLSKVKNSNYNTPENQQKISELIKADVNFLEQQNHERQRQRQILQEQEAQKKSQLNQLTGNKQEQEKQLALYQKEEEMFTALAPKGYVSQRDYIVVQRKTIEVRSRIKELETQMIEAQSALKEAQDQLAKLDNTVTKEAMKELNQLDSDLLETHHAIQRLEDSSKRLTIKAPITGIVKGLKVSPGNVLAAGEAIMDIVPSQGPMEVHCRVSTHDIGYVNVGDPAEIKVMSYDFARFGAVKGKVLEISANTFMNKDGLPYYDAKVSLEKNYVGKDPKQNLLKPGMTVQVDIITGKKTIMSYILKPITRAVDSSFKER